MAKGKKGTAVHGSRSMYAIGCRCQECRAAVASASRSLRERQRQMGIDHPELIPHGTYTGYTNWCCRCDECRKASREYQKNLKEKNGRKQTRWDYYTRAKTIAARKEKNKNADDAAPGGTVLGGPESGSA